MALRAATARPISRRRRAERPLRRRRAGGDAAGEADRGRCARRSATGSCTSSTSRNRVWPNASSTPISAARWPRPSTASRATFPATSSGSSIRRHECFFDVVRDPPGPLDWLSDDDLDVFVDSFRHHGTFAGGLNWYRNIDRNQELLAAFAGAQVEQPALFIGAEFDCHLRPDAGGGARHSRRGARTCATRCGSPTPGTGSSRRSPTQVNAALLAFLRLAGLGRSSTLIASAVVASGRPTDATSATACSTSSTLVGFAVGIEVLLEADVQVTAALEREARHRRGHEVAAPHRHRPRQVGALEHVEVGEQRVGGGRQPEGDARRPCPHAPLAAEVELHHRARGQAAGAVVGEHALQEPGLVDRELRTEAVLVAERRTPGGCRRRSWRTRRPRGDRRRRAHRGWSSRGRPRPCAAAPARRSGARARASPRGPGATHSVGYQSASGRSASSGAQASR